MESKDTEAYKRSYDRSHSSDSHSHRSRHSKSNERCHSRSRSRERYHSYTRGRYNDRRESHSRRSSTPRSRAGRSRSKSRSPNRRYQRGSRYRSRSTSRNRYSRYSSSSSSSRSSVERAESRSFKKNERLKHDAGSPRPVAISDLESVENEDDVLSETPAPMQSVFKNDGSFLEMFKKMQSQSGPSNSTPQEPKKAPLPMVGRRRGGKVLKTGIVEKPKPAEENDGANKSNDPWSIYIDEVKKYRQSSCQDEGKTRSLVK